MKILLVEDESHLAATLVEVLSFKHSVDVAITGQDGGFRAGTSGYDLIILDVSLPDISGFEVCAQLRKNRIATPILFLTAHADITSRVHGLDVGGDDYLVKPFSIAELEARVRALSRRPSTEPQLHEFRCGDFYVDTKTRRVFIANQEVEIRKKEYLLLEYLVRHLGQVVSKPQLWQCAWDFQLQPQTNTLEVHVAKLREKLKPATGVLLETCWGQGYRLSAT